MYHETREWRGAKRRTKLRSSAHRDRNGATAGGAGEPRLAATLRGVVRACDALLRHWHRVVEFDSSPDCLLRISVVAAERPLDLTDGTPLEPGDPIIEIHLWNDHVPLVPPRGPDVLWATRGRRQFVRSLERLAAYLAASPDLAAVKALVMRPAFAGRQLNRSLNRIVMRHGFEWLRPQPGRGMGRAYRFFDNLWLWLLTWTFNERSLGRRPFAQLRQEFWISRARFIATFGKPLTPQGGGARGARPPAE